MLDRTEGGGFLINFLKKKKVEKKSFLLLIGVFFFALFIRILNFKDIFVDENVIFVGYDPYYHMRRIALIVADFPHYIFEDSYIYYPKGAWIGWFPLYDQIVASLSLIFGLGNPSLHTIETVGAFFPPVLGALTIFPIYYIAKETFDNKTGMLSAVILAITPAHIHVSQLGFTDHHVAEVFLFTVILALFIIALKKGLIFSVLSGFSASLIVFMWTGSLLYLGIIFVYITVQYIFDLYMGRSSKYLTLLSTVMFGTVILIVTPIASSMAHWYWSPIKNQLIIITFFLGLFIAFLPISTLIIKKKVKWYWLPISLAAVFVPVLILIKSMVPSQYQYISGGFRYLSNEGLVLGTILEAEPWNMGTAIDQFTTTFFIFLIALTVFVAHTLTKIRDTKNSEILLIVMSIMAFLLTLFQTRFAYLLSVSISIITAYAFFKTLDILKIDLTFLEKTKKPDKKEGRKKNTKFGDLDGVKIMRGSLPLIFIIIVFFVPDFYVAVAETIEKPGIVYYDLDETLRWMRENTPKTSYYDNPSNLSQTPEYGVMSWWDNGNWIIYVARRPVVSNNFQWGIHKSAGFFTAKDEQSASDILNETKVRYIITDYRMGYYYQNASDGKIVMVGKFENLAKIAGKDPKKYYNIGGGNAILNQEYFDTMYSKLHIFDCANDKPSVNVTPLNHYRLIYESNKTAYQFVGDDIKCTKIFEYVRGARIIGRAEANENVTISVDVKTNRGRTFTYSNVVTSEKDGFFEIVVPYATEGTSYDTKPIGHYKVVCEKDSWDVKIDEQEILDGADIQI